MAETPTGRENFGSGDATASFTTQPRGAVISMAYQDRTVPGFVVSETELEEIYHSSFLVDFGVAIAFAALGFGIDLLKDMSLTPNVQKGTQDAAKIIYALCTVAFVCGGILVVWQMCRRHWKIRKIRGKLGYWKSCANWIGNWRKKRAAGRETW